MTNFARAACTSPPRAGRLRPLLALGLLLAGAAAAGGEPGLPYDADHASWTDARLEAHKLFRSMSVTVNVRRSSAAFATPRLIDDGGYALYPLPDPVLELHYRSDGLGRRTEVELLLEPRSGRMLQRSSLETGKRYKYRVYRFGAEGALRRTARPAAGETSAPADAWSDRTEQWFPAPAGVAEPTLTDPGALVYLVASAGLSEPGQRLRLQAFSVSDETFARLEAEVLDPEPIDVDYRLASPTGTADRSGRVEAVRIAIRDLAAAGGDEAPTLFGMTDVELLLDPATRAPLELRGRIGLFGQVHFHLRHLALQD